ncbi:MAG: OPT family oligopeptide transporter [Phycisphaerales bacterium]
MAIPQLTEEQIKTYTVAQKDRWWFENVFKGNMPQLTLRTAITGFILGGILSATNLYIGAKTGWSLGVGLTSVILAFALYRVISSIGIGKDFTILENNCMQSIATSAGYMTGPLISGLAAYMLMTNEPIGVWKLILFTIVLSLLGVLVAFPMKRRFINDEQAPFPEGAACGVVLDTLYHSDPGIGMFKAKALVVAGLISGGLKFLGGAAYMTLIQVKMLGLDAIKFMIPEHLDGWFYRLFEKSGSGIPTLWGADPRKFGLSPTLDIALFGAGGLMNIRYAVNMFAGMIIAYVGMAGWVVQSGWVKKIDAKTQQLTELSASSAFGYRDVLTGWLLWPGVAMLVCASMAAFFAKPQVFVAAFKGLTGKHKADDDVLKDIEFPLWISLVGVPVVGALGVWMMHDWFDVDWTMGALSVPLIIILTLIAATSTAATSITPTGAVSKITQFTFGVMRPAQPQVNLMTAVMTTEVASNASNLLMDIKPGYMLGNKPRHQAIGHCIGIVAGALASTPLFYIMFMKDNPKNPIIDYSDMPAKSMEATLITEQFGFPSAVQWKGIADFMQGLTGDKDITSIIHPSALYALGIAAVFGVVFEVIRLITKGKSLISPVALGLGFVIPPDSTLWMFLGSAFFWLMHQFYAKSKESFGNRLWVLTHEPICAGLIAGGALVGIGDTLLDVFLLGK